MCTELVRYLRREGPLFQVAGTVSGCVPLDQSSKMSSNGPAQAKMFSPLSPLKMTRDLQIFNGMICIGLPFR